MLGSIHALSLRGIGSSSWLYPGMVRDYHATAQHKAGHGHVLNPPQGWAWMCPRPTWTMCPSITVEITKASSCGYLIPCPSVGVKVMGSCQDLSWPIATKIWSPNLVLLLLMTPTLVDEPFSMTRNSRSAGPCYLGSSPSPSRYGSFFKNYLRYPCAKSISTFFLNHNNHRCHVLSLYKTGNTSWKTWGWDYALKGEDIEISFDLSNPCRSLCNWCLQGYKPFRFWWDVPWGVLSF